MNRNGYNYELRARARREREKKKRALVYTMAAILFLIAVLLFTLALSRVLADDHIYDFGGTEKKYSEKEVMVGGVRYVDMNEISKMCLMEKKQEKEKITYSVNGTSVSFTDGSSEARVNSFDIKLSGNARINGETCLVPLSDIKSFIPSLSVKTEKDKTEIRLKMSAENTYIMVSKGFEIDYLNDLSAYEKYIRSNDEKNTILINKQNTIGQNYEPERLVDVPDEYRGGKKERLDEIAEKALEAMMLDMRSAGVSDCYVTSSYRTYDDQERLFNNYIKNEMNKGYSKEEAKQRANMYSARGTESEHRTGLCLDFTTASVGGAVEEIFEGTAAFAWLSENAWKYGFILRYPEDKVDITGYDYEPWHYRFVGLEHSAAIYQTGLSLEEYLELIK